jgi:hypothetical protein
MTGRTLIVELHSWRGIGLIGGPLGTVLCLGFVSIGWLPFLLSHWLKQRLAAMKNAVGSDKFPPRVEMSCWNPDKPLHVVVPRGRT